MKTPNQSAKAGAEDKCGAIAIKSTSLEARNPTREAAAALNFWQALEYLAPQSPPKVKADDCVWALDANTPDLEMPWNSPNKKTILQKRIGPNWRFQLFTGIVSGDYLIETAREHLGAAPIDMSERMPPSAAACVVLNVNAMGMPTGQVFVSTVPWAMARIIETSDSLNPINFRGFFGVGGLDEKIRAEVANLLVERKLLAEDVPQEDTNKNGGATTGESAVNVGSSSAISENRPANSSQSKEFTSDPEPLRQVSASDIEAITDLIFEICRWRPKRQEPWRIQGVKASGKDADSEVAQDDPLNSFYAEDLERVSEALDNDDIGIGLREYLRGEDSLHRIDLDHNIDELIKGVHPTNQPHGCWPAKFPLVTAQQFAVNTLMRELAAEGGIFSVNGPPGTGKTTMLKDIVAAIVISRADVLAEFKIPDSAFKDRLDIEGYQYPAYKLDERLRGFGIVVSSANNGAVENITKELPGLSAIASGLNVNYFSVVADSVAAPQKATLRSATQERWGLIAAVLGNKTNRKQFANRFWFAGLPPKPKKGMEKDHPPPQNPLRLRSLRDLIQTGEHGAVSWEEARAKYIHAKKNVEYLIESATDILNALQTFKSKVAIKDNAQAEIGTIQTRLPGLLAAISLTEKASGTAQALASNITSRLSAFKSLTQSQSIAHQKQQELASWEAKIPSCGLEGAKLAHSQTIKTLQDLREDEHAHSKKQPGFLSELFRTESSKRWNARDKEFDELIKDARNQEKAAAAHVSKVASVTHEVANLRTTLECAQRTSNQLNDNSQQVGVAPTDTMSSLLQEHLTCANDVKAKLKAVERAQAEVDTARHQIRALQRVVAKAETDLIEPKSILTKANLSEDALRKWELTNLGRDTMHCAVPYEMTELFEARREVFVAAMELHKAFILASWRKLAPTLSAFMNVLNGSLHHAQVGDGVTHLWDAFFLVVPLVSTTFASFPRLFSGIKREELAWLLIDESGQATPQQATGAIWRAKRTVIVGDPLQLEPVVAVSNEMMAPLLQRCLAEPQWAPPAASAQTLADRANRYGMYLREQGTDDAVWLGSPLLVHRRCIDPMFQIANSIAYDNKMVYGASDDIEDEGQGPSRWIHIPAQQSDGHWIETQAHKAMELVQQITGGTLRKNGQFKVYVITPFRVVAQKMAALLDGRYEETKGMVGTVHTFQGKEAEHVIFLLGGNPKSPGVISSFAGARPNLVNVAVTRAKRRLYVIGDRNYWTGASDVHQIFTRMAAHLDIAEASTSASLPVGALCCG